MLFVAFAYLFGRSLIRLSQGRDRKSRTIAAALRAIAAGLAVAWRVGFDALTITVTILAILSFAVGMFVARRPERPEELEKVMFPRE